MPKIVLITWQHANNILVVNIRMHLIYFQITCIARTHWLVLLVRETGAMTCERVQIWSTATSPASSSCMPVRLNAEGEERERAHMEPTSKWRRIVLKIILHVIHSLGCGNIKTFCEQRGYNKHCFSTHVAYWRATWRPGHMFDPRPLFFNLYMGPNLFHDMWAPRCVVCSILFVGRNLFHSKWTIGV